MENENNENLNSPNEENESDDSAQLKEKNRQLFERAKKAETEAKELKQFKAETEAKEKAKAEKPKSGDKLLERLDKMALQVAGIKEADEVELYTKWKDQTGREADDIVGNDIFKKELESIRTAKANQAATSDISGGGDKSGGVNDNPDYWIAKATKGKDGKLEFPEETPKHLYSKILDKMSASEPGSSEKIKFYNG